MIFEKTLFPLFVQFDYQENAGPLFLNFRNSESKVAPSLIFE